MRRKCKASIMYWISFIKVFQLRKVIIILLICISQMPLLAQKMEIEAGVDGMVYDLMLPKFYAVSIVGGYYPDKAIFSINSGLSYFGYLDYIGIPINLHFKIGNNVKLRVPVGVTPFMRLDKWDWETRFGLIKNVGIGVEFKITSKINLYADFGRMFMPVYNYVDNKWGGENEYRLDNERSGFLRLGVCHEIKGKQAVR